MKSCYFFILIFFTSNVFADAVLLFETTNPGTPDKIEIKDRHIRLSNKADPRIILYDRTAKKLVFLNQDDKTYYEVTEKKLKKIYKKIKKLNINPANGLNEQEYTQLKVVIKKQGLQFNSTVFNQSIKKINTTSFKGIDCDVYTAAINGRLHSTHCIASGRYLGVNSADFKTYLYAMYFLKQAALGVRGIDPVMQNSFPGMPLVSYDAKGNKVRKFVSLRSENLERSLFVVPESYKKIKNH